MNTAAEKCSELRRIRRILVAATTLHSSEIINLFAVTNYIYSKNLKDPNFRQRVVSCTHGPGWISSWVDFDSNTTQKDSQDGQCPTAQRSEIQRAGLMY